jgi:molybdopterin converting factor small subunit
VSVELEVPSIFARYADDEAVFQVQGSTVGECLHDLAKQSPSLGRLFLDKKGNLGRTFDVYINGESAYPHEMTKPVKDGDKLNIVMLIYGG